MTQFKIVVTFGEEGKGYEKKETHKRHIFWGENNVWFLDLRSGYMSIHFVSVCQTVNIGFMYIIWLCYFSFSKKCLIDIKGVLWLQDFIVENLQFLQWRTVTLKLGPPEDFTIVLTMGQGLLHVYSIVLSSLVTIAI